MSDQEDIIKKRVSISADLSTMVYEDEKTLVRYLKRNYSRNFKIIKNGNDFALVLKYHNMMFVSIRGTDDSSDILANINFIPKKTDMGWVHSGFFNAARDLENPIFDAICKLGGQRLYTYICGHSLGGAIATIIAIKLKQMSFKIKGVFTFGAPRTGKGSFRKCFRKHIDLCRQFAFTRDPVPKVPRAYLWWKHPGSIVKLKHPDSSGWSFLWFGKVSEHSMEEYKEECFIKITK